MREREAFMDESFYEVRGSSPDTRLRRPLFCRSFGQEPGCFSMVVSFSSTSKLGGTKVHSTTTMELTTAIPDTLFRCRKVG